MHNTDVLVSHGGIGTHHRLSRSIPIMRVHTVNGEDFEMPTLLHLNTEKARLEPDAHFARPLDIVEAAGLTRGQKIAALKRWEQTLLDRIKATSEGMAPPPGQTATEAATVEEIASALRLLCDPALPFDDAR